MRARELLTQLRRRGVGVALEGGRIELRGAAVADLTVEDRRAIVRAREELLPILREEAARGWRPFWPPAPEGRCSSCGGTRFALSAALGAWHCVHCEPITSVPVAWADAEIRQEVQQRGA